MCSCGIQSTRRAVPPGELRQANTEFDAAFVASPADPHWRYFGQSRDFFYPLERVCGTEQDVDGMRASSGAALPVVMAAAAVCSAAALLF